MMVAYFLLLYGGLLSYKIRSFSLLTERDSGYGSRKKREIQRCSYDWMVHRCYRDPL
jgi:hypothetical protein